MALVWKVGPEGYNPMWTTTKAGVLTAVSELLDEHLLSGDYTPIVIEPVEVPREKWESAPEWTGY